MWLISLISKWSCVIILCDSLIGDCFNLDLNLMYVLIVLSFNGICDAPRMIVFCLVLTVMQTAVCDEVGKIEHCAYFNI